MAIVTAKNGQLVPRQEQQKTLANLVKQLQPEMERALPRHLNPERMARVALTALRTTPRLAECSPGSFAASLMNACQLGLEVNTPLGFAWIIPYKREATLQIGYQGYIELARRSGQLRSIYADVVREGDQFRYTRGLNPDLQHEPSTDDDRESRPMTHVYAVAHVKDSDPIFVVLTKAQVEARKKRSAAVASGRTSPWDTDEEAMWQKTGIRALWKWLPKSTEMAYAQAIDAATDQGRAETGLLSDSQTRALASANVFLEEPETIDAEEVGADLEAQALELMQAVKSAQSTAMVSELLAQNEAVLSELRNAHPEIQESILLAAKERREELAKERKV